LIGKYLKRINVNSLIDPAFPVRSGVAIALALTALCGAERMVRMGAGGHLTKRNDLHQHPLGKSIKPKNGS